MLPGHRYSAEDLIRILWRRKWVIAVPFVAAAVGAVLVTSRLPNKYRSETVILVVPQRVPEEYVRSTVTTRIEDRLSTIQQQILSRSRLEKIIQDLNLYPDQRDTLVMEDIVELMRRDIEGPKIERGDAFRVGYVSRDARLAQQVTERLASLFINENLRDRAVQAEGTTQFLDAQLEDARQRLLEQEKKLEQYRRQYAGQLPTQVDRNLQTIQGAQLRIGTLSETAYRDRELRMSIENQIAELESTVTPVPPPPPPATSTIGAPERSGLSTEQQLEAVKGQLRVLELRYKPEHPDIAAARRLIRDLDARLETERRNRPASTPAPPSDPNEAIRAKRLRELRSELANLEDRQERQQSEEARLRTLIDAYQANVNAAPTRESELIELSRDYTTLQESYNSLRAKLENSRLAADLERRQVGEQFKVLDAARIPERPFSPNRMRIHSMAALFGLFLGLGLVVLGEYLDKSLKTEEDVTRLLQIPVLALVPMMQSEREQHAHRRRRMLVAIGATVVVVASASVFAVWKLQAL